FRPDNRNRAQNGGEPAIDPNEQKTIGIVQVWSLRHSPEKHVDLLPQDQIFRLQLCSRPEERSQHAKNQLEQISHRVARLPRPFPTSTSNRIFGTHKARIRAHSMSLPLFAHRSAMGSIDVAKK